MWLAVHIENIVGGLGACSPRKFQPFEPAFEAGTTTTTIDRIAPGNMGLYYLCHYTQFTAFNFEIIRVKWVKELVLSVCQSSQSVCPLKTFEISTFTGLNNCCMW